MPGAIGKIPPQPWMIQNETLAVMAALSADKGEARFVGGCVRDALVNRPVIDIDIATVHLPETVIERLTANNIGHAPTGLQHGTVTAIANGKPFEITTLRRDIKGYGRHADVLFTDDWQTDASRRDFTYNALYANQDGLIYDYFGGIADLHAGRTLFVGDPETRIREDVLRILRFFRFHAHYGRGDADASALSACAHLAHLIPNLSAERIRQEVLKLLAADRAAEVWELVHTNGIATHFLPEATNDAALQKMIDLEARHGGTGFVMRRLAALLETTTEGLVRVTQFLRLSRAQAAQLLELEIGVQRLRSNIDINDVRKMIYRHGNDLTLSLLMLAAAKGMDGNLEPLYAETLSFRAPPFPVEGNDVINAGIPTGPKVGEILKTVENWWLDRNFEPGRRACLDKIAELAEAEL